MAYRLSEAEALDFVHSPREYERGLKYPWHDWCDGSWWCITQGEDYDTSPGSIRASLYRRAARYGWTVKVAQRDRTVVFRFDLGG